MSTEDAEALVTRWELDHGPPPDKTDPKAVAFWVAADAWLRKNTPRPTRPDDSTLRLALTTFDDILASPGLQPLQVSISFTPTSAETTVTEPEHRARRDLLVVLRKLDMPSHDARFDRVYPVIDRRGVLPDWEEGFKTAGTAWAERNEITTYKVEDPDIPRYRDEDPQAWIRPREAFELWVYGEVVHDDYSKELRWGRMGGFSQGLVRTMAHDLAHVMISQAVFLRGLIRQGLMDPLDPAA